MTKDAAQHRNWIFCEAVKFFQLSEKPAIYESKLVTGLPRHCQYQSGQPVQTKPDVMDSIGCDGLHE